MSICLKGGICRFRAGGGCVRFTREILYVSYKTDCNNNNTRLIHQREWGGGGLSFIASLSSYNELGKITPSKYRSSWKTVRQVSIESQALCNSVEILIAGGQF